MQFRLETVDSSQPDNEPAPVLVREDLFILSAQKYPADLSERLSGISPVEFLRETGRYFKNSDYLIGKLERQNLYLQGQGSYSVWIRRGKLTGELASGLVKLQGRVNPGDVLLLAGSQDLQKLVGYLRSGKLPAPFKSSRAWAIIRVRTAGEVKVYGAKPVIKLGVSGVINFFVTHARRLRIFLALILVFITVVIFWLNAPLAVPEDTDNEAQRKYTEAMAILDMNPIRARQLLDEAAKLVNVDARSQKLRAQIDAGKEFALKKHQVDWDVYFTAEAIRKQMKISDITDAGGHLWLFSENAVYEFDPGSKSVTPRGGLAGIPGRRAVAAGRDSVYILADTLYVLEASGQPVKQEIEGIPAADIGLLSFYADSLYVLDISASQIYRLKRINGIWTDKQDYLLFDTLVKFKNPRQMMIDGAVWVVDGSKIFKFVQGRQENWQVRGLDRELGENISIFVSDITRRLYIYDQDNRRIIVSEKEGDYIAQYYWDNSIQGDRFTVDEILGKIFLLQDGKIYSINIF